MLGFHNYEPDLSSHQQAKSLGGVVGNPHTEAVIESGQKRSLTRLTEWANKNNVPVINSFTTWFVIGYVDGKTEGPKNPEAVNCLPETIYDTHVTNGVPVTWEAL